MARWRWYRHEAKSAFDYRAGGPQRADPCKNPLSATYDEFGPEPKEHFEKRWNWTRDTHAQLVEQAHPEFDRTRTLTPSSRLARADTRPSLDYFHKPQPRLPKRYKEKMDAERFTQNKYDKRVYMVRHHQVEDSLFSLGTPAHVVFNHDKPLPDPALNYQEYNALVEKHIWNSSRYNHARAGDW